MFKLFTNNMQIYVQYLNQNANLKFKKKSY